MKPGTAILSLGLALAACNKPSPSRRPAPSTPAPSTPAAAPSTAANADADADADAPVPLQVFALAGGVCNRTPQPAGRALGPNAHPVFTRGIVEIELRGFTAACSRPAFTPSFEGNTLVLTAPDHRDANGCTCRHDIMLQVTGVPDSMSQVRFVRARPGADGGVDEVMVRAIDHPHLSPFAAAAAAAAADADAAAHADAEAHDAAHD